MTAVLLVAWAGCAEPAQPPEDQVPEEPAAGEPALEIFPVSLRRPALDRLHLVEGLNVIDRAPSGISLAARVSDGRITGWRAFDAQGEVALQQQSDGGMSDWEVCLLSGGEPGVVVDVEGKYTFACCWEDWGCLLCTADGSECEMRCDTQACKDANGQVVLPPDTPEEPDGGPVRPGIAVSPDQVVIAVDPETPGWTVQDADQVSMRLATTRMDGLCPVCARRGEAQACWELPCLPPGARAGGSP